MSPNLAAWLDGPAQPIRVGPSPYVHPGPSEVLIHTRAVSINPADAIQQSAGLLISTYPFILGCDVAGDIVEVGADVTRFSVGQRVVAQGSAVTHGTSASAAYQLFVIVPALPVCVIPDAVSFESACVLPLALSTAGAGLYPSSHLGLGVPSLTPEKTGSRLLVWGGSSSVGCCAIQLAVASGMEVVATCSPVNFGLCRRLGASEVFDYNVEGIVEELTSALGRDGRECVGAYAAIVNPEVMLKIGHVLKNVGGGFIASVFPGEHTLPEGVTSKFVHSGNFIKMEEHSGKYVWEDFLPKALASGQFVPAPEAEVVGKGLEAIEGALEAWRKGVSGRKIVVSL